MAAPPDVLGRPQRRRGGQEVKRILGINSWSPDLLFLGRAPSYFPAQKSISGLSNLPQRTNPPAPCPAGHVLNERCVGRVRGGTVSRARGRC